jgi:hypothetical protein
MHGGFHLLYAPRAVAKYPQASDELAATEMGEWWSHQSGIDRLATLTKVPRPVVRKTHRGERGRCQALSLFLGGAHRALRPR